MYSVLSKIINDKLLQVESLTNQEEVELRAKIEALGSEVTKVPSKSAQDLDEVVFKAVCQPTKCFEDKIDCFTALSSIICRHNAFTVLFTSVGLLCFYLD